MTSRNLLVGVVFLAGLLAAVGSGGLQWPQAIAAGLTYRAKIVAQSNYPVVRAGEPFVLWVKLKNTGTATWYRDGDNPFRIGIQRDVRVKPNDLSVTQSEGWNNFVVPFIFDRGELWKWTNMNRVAIDQATVRPGEVASCGIKLMAIDNPTAGSEQEYRVRVAPVVEYLRWLPNNIYWVITVRNRIDYVSYQNNQVIDFVAPGIVGQGTVPTISQGIYGYVSVLTGDCMPTTAPPGTPSSCSTRRESRKVFIRDVVGSHAFDGVYLKQPSRLIATTSSSVNGFYEIALEPGDYSILVEDSGQEYCSLADDVGLCHVAVARGVQRYDISIDLAGH